MHSYRNRPKGNYIQEASWQDLYILAENWKNNLEFQLFEIEFLQRLIETYFVKLLLCKNLDELREIQKDLSQANNETKDLLQRIQLYLNHIVDILDDPIKYDASIFRDELAQLEDAISRFIAMQKTLKFTVFKLTKGVLENEKPTFFWKYN